MGTPVHKDESGYFLLSQQEIESEGLITGNEESDSKEVSDPPSLVSEKKWMFWRLVSFIEFLAITLLVTLLFRATWTNNNLLEDISVYTLAHEAVELETVVFHSGLDNDMSLYQGPPSAELDARWDNLFLVRTQTQISKEEANRLPNRTSQIPGQPGQYIAVLSVFHELHCLNRLRQAMYPDYYPEKDVRNATFRTHLEHCIEILRQSSMCYPDRHPVVYQWSEKKQMSIPNFNVVHQCVNFDKIHEWAETRYLKEYYASTWVEGNPRVLE